jgi:superfamily II DNA or RNA helicase
MTDVTVIRKSGNMLDISSNGKALDKAVRGWLEPVLSYVYVQPLFGAAKFEAGGNSFRFEPRRLYRYDNLGRLICGRGFLEKIKFILEENNVSWKVLSKKVDSSKFVLNWDAVYESISFRARQEECLKKIINNECGVIAAPTGFGKGILILAMCLLFNKAKIDIVLPGKDLVSKTVRLLRKYLPNVGQVGFQQNNVERVTVYSADSLHLSDGTADILIADEAHQLMAPSYGTALAKYRYSRNYAFTATPEGRMDNADLRLESIFGPVIFSMTYQEAVDLELVVPIRILWLDAFGKNQFISEKKDVAKWRHALWRNEHRNEIFAKALEAFKDEQILILVKTLEHAVFLKKLLPHFSLCYDKMSNEDRRRYIKWGFIEKSEPMMTPALREQMRQDFECSKLKHVIATMIWAEGVSFDALPILVWAGGGSSAISTTQIPGRVCRIHKETNKQYGLVIDCCDQFDEGLERQADQRFRYYKKHGWEQCYQDGRKRRKKRIQY